MKYGLIGERLSHSFSKEIHEALTDYAYEIRELERDRVTSFLESRKFQGINVTIPYKETVIPHLDDISAAAQKIGAVNTIVNKDGKLYGDNTDHYGMTCMIKRANIDIKGKKVLILGTGGTSKTARAVLSDLQASQTVIVSRQKKPATVTYEEAKLFHSDAEVIVNTTPVGMYPNCDTCPIDISDYPELSGVVDVIYNPLRTRLVLDAEARKIPATGGLNMLILQAARAVEIFLEAAPDADKVEEVIKNITLSKENIVLIGMPGCGKSTVGALIAKMSGRTFADTDTLIKEMSGMYPSQIIKERGERAFRDIETEAVRIISKKNGLVIATGGGIVTRTENIPLLRQNGRIFYLQCPTDELPVTPDRPLSSDIARLQAIYAQRHPLYTAAADITIPITHKKPPEIAAEDILLRFNSLK